MRKATGSASKSPKRCIPRDHGVFTGSAVRAGSAVLSTVGRSGVACGGGFSERRRFELTSLDHDNSKFQSVRRRKCLRVGWPPMTRTAIELLMCQSRNAGGFVVCRRPLFARQAQSLSQPTPAPTPPGWAEARYRDRPRHGIPSEC